MEIKTRSGFKVDRSTLRIDYNLSDGRPFFASGSLSRAKLHPDYVDLSLWPFELDDLAGDYPELLYEMGLEGKR